MTAVTLGTPAIEHFLCTQEGKPTLFVRPEASCIQAVYQGHGVLETELRLEVSQGVPSGTRWVIPFHRHPSSSDQTGIQKSYRITSGAAKVIVFVEGGYVVHPLLISKTVWVPQDRWHAVIYTVGTTISVVKFGFHHQTEWELDTEVLLKNLTADQHFHPRSTA
jgi:hypothetical protein